MAKKQQKKSAAPAKKSTMKTPKKVAPKKDLPISKKVISSKSKAEEPELVNISSDILGMRKTLGFPVVGIGASAGGLDALQELFKSMPDRTGMGFIVVSHLDPSHVSLLPELLQKNTKLQVCQVTNNMQVKSDCVYIIPPNKSMKIVEGMLLLTKFTQPRASSLPIDIFLRSLADDQGPNAIAIILSGTGTDGTLGLRAIKGELGMGMVQNEESAKYDGMPRSAINTGLADYILSPKKMPDQLIKYAKHSGFKKVVLEPKIDAKISDALHSIFAILRLRTNHDFSLYKKNTISRRIERRMNVHQIDKISGYLRYLRENEHEVDILFKELLIGVTNFFRNPEAFGALENQLLELLKNKHDEYMVRAWVPGCSTGEEAYSIAILLHEVKQKFNKNFSVQVFGTDIDEESITSARAGLYPASIATDLDEERLKRYFTREDDGQYRIRKMIREMVVFAPQNLIKDPPFTKLDILSCRNLLIYLGAELQKKLFPVFHYSLKPNGILFLGSSETIGQSSELFSAIDKKWKMFVRKPLTVASRGMLSLPTHHTADSEEVINIDSSKKTDEVSTYQLIETILQQSNTPPSVIIDNAGDVVYIHGRTGRYLEPPEGRINTNITEMARPGLKSALVTGIHKVNLHKQEVITSDLSVPYNGGEPIVMDLLLKPIIDQSTMRNLIMVQFQELTSHKKSAKFPSTPEKRRSKKTADEFEKELQYTKENLQTTIEELETSNEELKSTNEELQSTNEELQSTNEEMETSKEELQSLNEESITVNAELQSRIDELSQANDDMKNLLDSTDIATIFLDEALCLRRFTPCSKGIVPLTATDIGRPISHFTNNLIDMDLAKYGEMVLDDLAIRVVEAKSKDGSFYQMRVRPYRTVNNVIDGVVITFHDITEAHQSEDVLKASEGILREFMKAATYGFILLDENLNQIEVNDTALEITERRRQDLLKARIEDILPDIKTKGRYKEYMHVIKTGIPFYIDDFIVDKEKKIKKHVELTAFKVGPGIGIIINDITERKGMETKRKTLISDQKSQISDQKSQISDQKSQISDQKSQISDQKSQISKQKKRS